VAARPKLAEIVEILIESSIVLLENQAELNSSIETYSLITRRNCTGNCFFESIKWCEIERDMTEIDISPQAGWLKLVNGATLPSNETE
jgi:hypothetical protein